MNVIKKALTAAALGNAAIMGTAAPAYATGQTSVQLTDDEAFAVKVSKRFNKCVKEALDFPEFNEVAEKAKKEYARQAEDLVEHDAVLSSKYKKIIEMMVDDQPRDDKEGTINDHIQELYDLIEQRLGPEPPDRMDPEDVCIVYSQEYMYKNGKTLGQVRQALQQIADKYGAETVEKLTAPVGGHTRYFGP